MFQPPDTLSVESRSTVSAVLVNKHSHGKMNFQFKSCDDFCLFFKNVVRGLSRVFKDCSGFC